MNSLRIVATVCLCGIVLFPAAAQEVPLPEPPGVNLAVDLPSEIRVWFRNPDGSCVQCSIGMLGVDQNIPAAATLLWDSQYGPRERGGSGPGRVARYCDERGIRAISVTGSETVKWIQWAAMTGRGAAISAGWAHVQTLMGYDPATRTWYVCDNNTPWKIDAYDNESFLRLHRSSGQWAVILDYPPHPQRPVYQRWW